MVFGKKKLAKPKNPFINNLESCMTLMDSTTGDVSANPFASLKPSRQTETPCMSTMNSSMSSTNDNAAIAPMMSSLESNMTQGNHEPHKPTSLAQIDTKPSANANAKTDRNNPMKKFTTEQFTFTEAPFAVFKKYRVVSLNCQVYISCHFRSFPPIFTTFSEKHPVSRIR